MRRSCRGRRRTRTRRWAASEPPGGLASCGAAGKHEYFVRYYPLPLFSSTTHTNLHHRLCFPGRKGVPPPRPAAPKEQSRTEKHLQHISGWHGRWKLQNSPSSLPLTGSPLPAYNFQSVPMMQNGAKPPPPPSFGSIRQWHRILATTPGTASAPTLPMVQPQALLVGHVHHLLILLQLP